MVPPPCLLASQLIAWPEVRGLLLCLAPLLAVGQLTLQDRPLQGCVVFPGQLHLLLPRAGRPGLGCCVWTCGLAGLAARQVSPAAPGPGACVAGPE